MADVTLIGAICMKIFIMILSSLILSQMNSAYASSYKVIVIYIVASITLLYCVVTILVHIGIGVRCPKDTTSFAISEIILASIGMIAWLFISGVAGSTAWRSGADTSVTFAWICAGAGVICFVLGLIALLFYARIGMDKVYKGGKRKRETCTKTPNYLAPNYTGV